MTGETVIAEDFEQTGKDPYGKPENATFESAVSNVLVAPGATDDVIESNRADGVSVAYTLYFPNSFTGNLEGKRVKVRGEWFGVIGSPRPYNPETTPTPWNLVVEVVKVDG